MDGTLTLSMTLKRLLMGTKEPPLPTITRRAVDTSGRLGSLYNAYEDIIFGTMNVNSKKTQWETLNTRRCMILDGSPDLMESILKIFDVEYDLRLSLSVNLREKTGIAEIIDDDIEMNEYTRLFYYSYWNREVNLIDDDSASETFAKTKKAQTKATHIVTGIRTGIDLIVLLQLPINTRIVAAIDNVLHKTRTHLLDREEGAFELTSDDEKILQNVLFTKVYSNMFDLRYVNNFYDICRYMEHYENNSATTPVSYLLRSIRWLYPGYFGPRITCLSIDEETSNNIEEKMTQLRHDLRQLQRFIYEHLPKLLNGHLRHQSLKLQKTFSDLNKKCLKEIDHLGKSVVDVRSARKHVSLLDGLLNNSEQNSIRYSMDNLTQIAKYLEEKACFIISLNQQQMRYLNIAECGIDYGDNLKDIERKLITNEHQDRCLCSTDALNETKAERLGYLRLKLTEELKTSVNLRLTYADFTYSSLELDNIIILPLDSYLNAHNIMSTSLQKNDGLLTGRSQQFVEYLKEDRSHIPIPTATSTAIESNKEDALLSKTQTSDQKKSTDSHEPLAETSNPQIITDPSKETPWPLRILLEDTDTINILLLGETGVGKSTFINAFINYVTFDSLQQAQSKKPLVLIPVSFLMTVGDHSEERLVQCGDMNRFKDEDFEHPGQSVTQQCRSYVVQLNHNEGKQLRFIDTPGFGDSRGIDQDNHQMQHILEYISNLTHLNAICFLLKSDQSRLNISFRSCFTQLFTLLDRNALNYLLFCFTNSRLTSYTPGDTAQSLKRVLDSLSMGDIPFSKENTFCFDNESIRYLAARRNHIQFHDIDKENFETSWSISTTQAHQFVDYVCRKVSFYRLENNLRSMTHVGLKIIQLIRPILESMRNLLRNLLLNKTNPIRVSIELRPIVLDHPITICTSCNGEIIEIDHFFIELDTDHQLQQRHCPCKCSEQQHQYIEYILDYELSSNASIYDRNEMMTLLNRLCYVSAEFSYCLLNDSYQLENDRFLSALVNMIQQEENICKMQKRAPMNSELVKELNQIKQQYTRYIHELELSKKISRLSVVYKRIKDVSEYPMVREQLDAFQQGQKVIMRNNEFQVSDDLNLLMNK